MTTENWQVRLGEIYTSLTGETPPTVNWREMITLIAAAVEAGGGTGGGGGITVETDPKYTADKPLIAHKSEVQAVADEIGSVSAKATDLDTRLAAEESKVSALDSRAETQESRLAIEEAGLQALTEDVRATESVIETLSTSKADAGSVYSKTDTYSRSEVDSKITGGVRYKGSVPTKADLATDAEIGDMYNVTEDDMNYIWDGSEWDPQAPTFDLSGYAKSEDLPTALSQLINDINAVVDADYVHTDNNYTNEDRERLALAVAQLTELTAVATVNGKAPVEGDVALTAGDIGLKIAELPANSIADFTTVDRYWRVGVTGTLAINVTNIPVLGNRKDIWIKAGASITAITITGVDFVNEYTVEPNKLFLATLSNTPGVGRAATCQVM